MAGPFEGFKTGKQELRPADLTEWFTRRNNHHPYIRITPAYDLEPRASSSHDVLVSHLLALQLYNLYVAGQFALLQQRCSAET